MKVIINENIYEYKDNTTYYEISKEFQKDFKNDILLVKVNGIIKELREIAQSNDIIEFLTYNDDEGRESYIRTTLALFFKSINKVFAQKHNVVSSLKFTQNKGYYISPNNNDTYSEEEINEIINQVNRFIEEKIIIKKLELSTNTALTLLKKYDTVDKELLIKFSLSNTQNLYEISGFYGLSRGFYLYDTSFIKQFKVTPYGHGFFLSFPEKNDFSNIKSFTPLEKVFKVQIHNNQWLINLNIHTAGFMNEKIANNQFNNVIILQEAQHQKEIVEIAEKIKNSNKKLIFIAGPSSSGKTSFSYRLSYYLQTFGLNAHQISCDNFFKNRDDTLKDENGEYDFESINCVDVDTLNSVLKDLLDGKKVEMPKYDFIFGKRYFDKDFLCLKDNDILILEGIHCLNDKLTSKINSSDKYKICVTPFTQVPIDYENRIPTSDLRLIRRIVRDNTTRGFSAIDTIKMWPKVRKGEEENIFPYQETADVMFNSSLCYELNILKMYAEPLLFNIDKTSKEYVVAQRLLKYLDYFLVGNEYAIPKYSLLKEFTNDSVFNVK